MAKDAGQQDVINDMIRHSVSMSIACACISDDTDAEASQPQAASEVTPYEMPALRQTPARQARPSKRDAQNTATTQGRPKKAATAEN